MKRNILFFLSLVLFLPLFVSAATTDTTISGLIAGGINTCTAKNCIPDLLNGLFTASLSVGAMLAVLRIAYAGWLYMGSADMWSNKSAAKDVFQDAILGLLLLLGVWLILYQINPDILNLDFSRSLSGGNSAPATSPYPGAAAPLSI